MKAPLGSTGFFLGKKRAGVLYYVRCRWLGLPWSLPIGSLTISMITKVLGNVFFLVMMGFYVSHDYFRNIFDGGVGVTRFGEF